MKFGNLENNMKNKSSHAYTRTYNIGRIPSLRDKILAYLETQKKPQTAKEIAEAIGIHKSTPYRPLKELVKLELLTSDMGIDGEEFSVDKEHLNDFKLEPRRIKSE